MFHTELLSHYLGIRCDEWSNPVDRCTNGIYRISNDDSSYSPQLVQFSIRPIVEVSDDPWQQSVDRADLPVLTNIHTHRSDISALFSPKSPDKPRSSVPSENSFVAYLQMFLCPVENTVQTEMMHGWTVECSQERFMPFTGHALFVIASQFHSWDFDENRRRGIRTGWIHIERGRTQTFTRWKGSIWLITIAVGKIYHRSIHVRIWNSSKKHQMKVNSPSQQTEFRALMKFLL